MTPMTIRAVFEPLDVFVVSAGADDAPGLAAAPEAPGAALASAGGCDGAAVASVSTV